MTTEYNDAKQPPGTPPSTIPFFKARDAYEAIRYCSSCDRMTMGEAWATVASSGWNCATCGTAYLTGGQS